MLRMVLYGVAGGLVVAALRWIEYQHLVRVYPGELYGGLLAAIFLGLGVWAGRRSRAAARLEVAGPAVATPVASPGIAGEAAVLLGITPRELEILGLIAAGLSNREIAGRVFITENTVKTHSSRLFEKLGAQRRTQAVQRARELGILVDGGSTKV